MWKDILRRRWVSTKYHPEFWLPKIGVILGILCSYRMAFFFCVSAIMGVILNMACKEEEFLIPISDREYKTRCLEESLFYAGSYSFLFFIHNLVFIFAIKDPFTVENSTYLLLLNVFVLLFSISVGLSMKFDEDRKAKTVLQTIWRVVNDIAGGFLLAQIFDFFVTKGLFYQKFHFFFVNPDWYIPTIIVVSVLEMITIVTSYKKIQGHDLASMKRL